jgi:tight adherence protein B
MFDSPLILGLGALFLLVLFGAVVAFVTSSGQAQVDQRLEEFVGGGAAATFAPAEMDMPREAMADRMDRAIAGRGFTGKIRERIARADVKLRVTEYIALQFLTAFGLGAAGYYLMGGWFMAVIGGLVGYSVPRFYCNFAAKRRLQAFDSQLSDTLNLWVNALRSGYSVLQGMEAIATELPKPVSAEFERVVQEVRLGLSVSQALDNMLRRVPSEDLDLVITAVNIQREVGGNLADILDIISFTIRERVRIKGEIRTLTAQGRASGWIITLLPVALGAILFMINPDYMGQLTSREPPMILNIVPCGWLVIGFSLMMIAAGAFAIQKIVDIEV